MAKLTWAKYNAKYRASPAGKAYAKAAKKKTSKARRKAKRGKTILIDAEDIIGGSLRIKR